MRLQENILRKIFSLLKRNKEKCKIVYFQFVVFNVVSIVAYKYHILLGIKEMSIIGYGFKQR